MEFFFSNKSFVRINEIQILKKRNEGTQIARGWTYNRRPEIFKKCIKSIFYLFILMREIR